MKSISIYVICIGVVLLLYGIYSLWKYIAVRRWALRSEGTVYDITDKKVFTEDGWYTVSTMTVGFITYDNDLVIKEIRLSYNRTDYRKGETLTVLYEKGNTDHFELDNGESPAYTYFICLFPGSMLVATGIWMAVL